MTLWIWLALGLLALCWGFIGWQIREDLKR